MAKAKHPNVNLANRYARDVVAGRVVACKWVRLACERHLNDLKKEKQRAFPYRFDRKKGEAVCTFAGLMVHVKGKWAGSRIRLEPWQAFFLAVPFGWVRKKDGLRRFREIYAEIPRKNGKSVLGAILGNYMLTADGEPGAEVYSGATTEKQAWEVFRPAKLMTERSPAYRDYYGVGVAAKNLHVLATASRFEPLIGNPGDGSSPHCAIIDEYHEHKTPDQYDTMATGMGARTQPLLAIITTAGTNLAGPCYDKRDQVLKVLEGAIENDELFGLIFTIDEDDEWSDFEVWKKANPNFGVSVFEDYLRARHREAMQRASRQNIVRCKHLNQWMNADTAWMNMLAWGRCRDAELSLFDFEGEPCWAGLDLSSKTDLAAKVRVFKRKIEGKAHYYAFGTYYLPEDTIELPENRHYQTWQLQDLLTETPGAVIDYQYIEDDLHEDATLFELKEVPYDPFQATQLSTRMAAEGFPMVEFRPTVLNFSEPMKELEKLILERRFHHTGDPVMTWMMSNVVAHTDKKDNIYPNKDRPENKIDGVIALIMALARAIAGEFLEPEEVTQGFVDLEAA